MTILDSSRSEINNLHLLDEAKARIYAQAAEAAPDMLMALRNARAWVRHWKRDFDAGLKPTPESLASAEADLTAAIINAGGRS